MENLAGSPYADERVRRELARGRITPVAHPDRIQGEVPTRTSGRLGRFQFRRYWRYWVVEGPLPLEIALELYADPVGATDIRVRGDAGCTPPEEWVEWLDSNGTVLASRPGMEAELAQFSPDSQVHRTCVEQMEREEAAGKTRWVEDPAAEGTPHITSYHIDTEVGLRVFTDTLRRYGLT